MTMKRLLLKIIVCFCILPFNLSVKAQWVTDSFNPNVEWMINTIVLQPDGKILIGGDFNKVGGQARNNLVRVNADGSLDSAFNPNVNGEVLTITLQSDNKILLGGAFTSVNGQSRNNIARLNADGTLDSLVANINGSVKAITLQSDGKIWVGGEFNKVGAIERKYLARLNPDGSLDSFDGKFKKFVQFDSSEFPNQKMRFNCVNSIVLNSDGNILVGGYFRVTTKDLFTPNAPYPLDSINFAVMDKTGRALPMPHITIISDPVNSISVQTDGKILIGGESSAGGLTKGLIRVDAAYLPDDTTFKPNWSGNIVKVVAQADGKILIAGIFNDLKEVKFIARLNSDGTIDNTFSLPASERALINTFTQQPDGKILLGGVFTIFGNDTRNSIARFYNKDNYTSSFVSRWKSDQTINIQSSADNKGKLQSSAVPTSNKLAQWELIRVAGTNFYRIRNVAIPTRFLNIEKGVLEASEVPESFQSGHWELEKVVEGTNEFYRIKSRWKPDNYINIEKGTLESSTVPAAFYSGMWKMN